jgi:hypothetical protein
LALFVLTSKRLGLTNKNSIVNLPRDVEHRIRRSPAFPAPNSRQKGSFCRGFRSRYGMCSRCDRNVPDGTRPLCADIASGSSQRSDASGLRRNWTSARRRGAGRRFAEHNGGAQRPVRVNQSDRTNQRLSPWTLRALRVAPAGGKRRGSYFPAKRPREL